MKRKTITNESIVPCDIDGTLVSLKRYQKSTPETIAILNPYVNKVRYVKIHHPNVELLKEMLGRGRFIFAWSGSGVLWVDAVLDALGIDHQNIISMTKPIGYIDDFECADWLKNRIFLECEGLEHG